MSQIAGLEISSAFTVTRRFPVECADPSRIEQAVGELDGIASGDAGRGGKGIVIRYDAARVGYAEIERVLGEAGFAFRHNRWTKIKAAWFRFVDENSRANAKRKAGPCCNRPPDGLG